MNPAVWAPTAPHAAPPSLPVVVLAAKWIDVSNYQGNLSPGWFAEWQAQGYGGLIVQGVTGNDGRTFTKPQIAAALDAGWQVAGYVWCSPGDATSGNIFGRVDHFRGYAPHLQFLALDVEATGTTVDDVKYDLAVCDQFARGTGPSPIYTARWFFDAQDWTHMDLWADRRLWDAYYSNSSDIDAGFGPYGGWTQRWMRQWTDTPVDQNVLRQ